MVGRCRLQKENSLEEMKDLCCSKFDGGLGLKDFESFNLALLAKQWWRLLQNENSLCHKVLKANYFPNSSPSNASNGFIDSYLWNSLREGKKVVDQGAMLRVGDRKKIDVWIEKWIKKPPTFKVQPIDQN